jgi:dienelactone hydrolase
MCNLRRKNFMYICLSELNIFSQVHLLIMDMKDLTPGIEKSLSFRFKLIPGIIIALLFITSPIYGQEDLDVIQRRNSYWLEYSDAQNSLYRHIAREAYQMLEERQEVLSAISSLSGWQSRQEMLRHTLTEIAGPFPAKSALNARITRTVKKDGFRIEHIIFESRPGFYITSSMYIPEGNGLSPLPAVIYCSGHTVDGYRSKTYQHVIINLVKKGFVVFAFDPVGQGERLEYYDPETGKSAIGSPTHEHSYPGAQAFITGGSQARYMIWDGIRAVDYLLTRSEVDPERIGITGRSGGGTQSAYIAALDDRIYAAAPEAYITTITRLLQSIGPQDAEQNLPGGIKMGIDHADLLAVRAPRPALIVATTNDFFSIQGSREAFRELQAIYNAYGEKGNIDMVEDLGGHESTRKNREAMYAFFQEHLQNHGSPEDMEVAIPDADELRVTSTGQQSTSLNGETVFSLNMAESLELSGELTKMRKTYLDNIGPLIKSARKLSGYRNPDKPGEPVYTGRIVRDGYIIEKYFIKGEGEYVVPYLLMIPDEPGTRSLIYIHPEGKAASALPGGHPEWFVRKGFTVLVPDLAGTGETGPGIFRGDAFIDGVSYNIWFASVLTGRSIAGIRAGDVVKLTQLLKGHHGKKEIYALAMQEMAPVLLHAAAFEPSISSIALLEPLSSYESLVTTRFYKPEFIHGAVPGMLRAYDLPDLAASLVPRRLMLVNPVDGAGKLHDMENISNDISVIVTAYQNAQDSLIIESGTDTEEYFLKWIGK